MKTWAGQHISKSLNEPISHESKYIKNKLKKLNRVGPVDNRPFTE